MELLVASAYGGPQPFTLPGSAHVGFLRFLRLLATHDFDAEPVIVDPHGEWLSGQRFSILVARIYFCRVFVSSAVEMSHGDLAEIRRLFREERATYPAIFIGTPHVSQSGSSLLGLTTAKVAYYMRKNGFFFY